MKNMPTAYVYEYTKVNYDVRIISYGSWKY